MNWTAGIISAVSALLLIVLVSLTQQFSTFNQSRKPPWQPPNVLFGIVWPLFYISLILSILFSSAELYLNKWWIITAVLFFSQLLLNVTWPLTFKPGLYLYGVIMLAAVFALTASYITILFSIQDSGYLLSAAILPIPYLIWIGLALSLNVWYYMN